MKDNSTLKSLNRKLEVRFKESQLSLAKMESILAQRELVEIDLISEINNLEGELSKLRDSRRSQFLSGQLNKGSYREDKIIEEVSKLKKKLESAKSEKNLAQNRVEKAKIELEALYKEKEGFLRIEGEREIQNERIKVETSDSN